MAGFFDDLINDPLFSLGTGLLAASGPSTQPVNFGQTLATGLQFASAAQQRQQEGVLQQLRVQEARQRVLDQARQRQAGSALAEFVDMLGPQAAVASVPGAAGVLPGGGATAALGAPPASMPGILSQEQAAFLRRLAPIAPDFVGQQVAGLLFSEPQQPTNLEREFAFLTGLGIPQEQALAALRKGTVVNVAGDAEKPLSVDDLAKVRLPDGSTPPIGTTPSQARAMGAAVITADELAKARSADGALAILDQIEELAVGTGGVLKDVEPGFLNLGAAAFSDTINLLTQNDPAVAQLQSLSQGAGASIVRAMGERGALSDGDVQRALGLLPQVGNLSELRLPDTRATATAKLKQLRTILERGMQNLERLGDGAAPAPVDTSQEQTPLTADEQTLLATPADQLDAAGQRQLDTLLKQLGF